MEKRRFWKNKYFSNQSLRTKLILPVIITMAVSLGINLLLFGRIDTIVKIWIRCMPRISAWESWRGF